MTRTRVAVVGGGLAGVTAALRCADAGCEVTLLESRPWLGGLTYSFRRGDLWVDNGQHVFLRCCTRYLALLERLGVSGLVTLQPRLDVPVRSAGTGATSRLRRNGLPAPLHLGGSLARFQLLSPRDRLGVVRAALALRSVDPSDARTDEQSFGAWLAAHRQSPRSIEALWDLIGVAALNARSDEASLALAATVFQQGLLDRADAGDIGWPRVPLGRLHGTAMAEALAAAGVTVHSRTRVHGLQASPGAWLLAAGPEQVVADAVVLAVPPSTAEALMPAGAVALPRGWSDRLGSAPIVNLHVRYDRKVLDEPFLAAVDSPLQWVFDRTDPAGLREGQYLAVSLSAAADLVDTRTTELRDRLLPALTQLLPSARAAHVEEVFVTRERNATFSPAPGSGRLRPPQLTYAPGLYLAGAWTATGWPATMEGAVRSGEAAAAALLSPDAAGRRAVAA
ncbi:MAG TPA: hydroxysqualene dehydroxylase HpnE [Kribbella sp.]|nr:hydroxysqualene dehydroxylase HpnE [Kribbella sp.]